MLTAGVLFIRDVPLETTRLPASEPSIQRYAATQDVDARLWQDPFGAVARAREDAAKRNPNLAKAKHKVHTLESMLADIKKRAPGNAEILAVMLPGGPYSDDVESRRRARYAVLAGLRASRLAPSDGEHIGYFFPSSIQGDEELPAAPEMPEIVPYEWFDPAPEAVPHAAGESKTAVRDKRPETLVLWLDSDVYIGEPLKRLHRLIDLFKSTGASWRVIGPSDSDGLRDMVKEVEKAALSEKAPRHVEPKEAPLKALPLKDVVFGKGAPMETVAEQADTKEPAPVQDAFDKDDFKSLPLRLYSAVATAPDERVLSALDHPPQHTTVADYLAQNNVRLVRTIGDDSGIADALISELELRGLRASSIAGDRSRVCAETDTTAEAAPSHIAVISEWDTFYGRTLRREFRASNKDKGFCAHSFTYVRGLDGQPANVSAEAAVAKAASGKTGDGNGKDENRRRDGTFVEVAEGMSQFDYLRRLSVQMSALDRRLREGSSDGKGLSAIGVLGSDVHDKLLVLQALRPEFPNAIFFTTDLDARFLHPRERPWTRNLLVASSFGLRLADAMQFGMPPFRDSYQTSYFLSTRLAMDDALRYRMSEGDVRVESSGAPTAQEEIAHWFRHPRIFEIGRTTAFDFSPKPDPAGEPAQPAAGASGRPMCTGPTWEYCGGIHPPPSDLFPKLHASTLGFIALIIVLTLWIPVLASSKRARKCLYAGVVTNPDGKRKALWCAALVLPHIAIPLLVAEHWPAFATWLTSNGKPLVALEGISIWPTEAIRFVAFVLCLYLVLTGWLALTENLDRILGKFKLGLTRKKLEEDQAKAEKGLKWHAKLTNMFSPRSVLPQDVGDEDKYGMPRDVIDFWRRYVVQNRATARAVRTLAWAVIALLASAILLLAMRDGWYIPQRGPVSVILHRSLHWLMIAAMYFLVFFVVDATALCVKFVRDLQRRDQNWPPSTLEVFEHELQVPRAYLDKWIDLKCVAMRTKSVTRLIYFPFIVISLFLVSRSAAFDHWYMPASGIALAILGALIALGNAVALRFAAEESRKEAVKLMRNAIMRVSGDSPRAVYLGQVLPPERPMARQLELLLARMENLDEGAFAPFWQQPLLKAVLLPFATVGGTTLLDYLSLVNV